MFSQRMDYTEDKKFVPVKTFPDAKGNITLNLLHLASCGYADRNRSDPFAYRRARAAVLNGNATLADIGKDTLG